MKNILLHIALFSLIFLYSCREDVNISPSGELTRIPVIDVIIDHYDYLSLLENKLINYEVPCKIIYKERIIFGRIRAAGAGSRYLEKWSYTVELEDGEVLEGLSKFNLNCQTYDPTMMRTHLALFSYRTAGVHDFMAKHIFMRLNGRDHGLYLLIERINERYFYRRQVPFWHVYKIGFGTQFSFRQVYNPKFSIDKEIPDDDDYSTIIDLIHACDTASVEDLGKSFGKFLNIRQYMKYHAVTSMINNPDAFTNNFILFKREPLMPFEVIPWDFDNSFTLKTNVPLNGSNHLGDKILSNEEYREEYKEFMKEHIDNAFNEEKLFPIIDSLSGVIRNAYNLDPYLGKGRYDLDEEIKALKTFISDRIHYIEKNIDNIK